MVQKNEARINIYLPVFRKKRLEKELPPEVSAASIANDAWQIYLDNPDVWAAFVETCKAKSGESDEAS